VNRLSLAARATLALGGAVGFYVLAIALAAGFFWLAMQGSIVPGVSLALAIIGVVILRALVPRIDRFEPPETAGVGASHLCSHFQCR
jgi:hypothetical protein